MASRPEPPKISTQQAAPAATLKKSVFLREISNAMRYLDPKNDLTFKKVFGEHPHLLISFLNALLPLEVGAEIAEIEYLPAQLTPRSPLMKNSIVDVRCTDKKGRQFIVEMQMLWTDSFKSRVLFNASKAFVKQLGKSKNYERLQPVYALSLVNQNFEHDTDEHYHHYSIIHNELTGKKLEGLEFVFIELQKFKAKNLTEKKIQILWLRYLTEIEDQSTYVPEALLENPLLNEAVECLQESAFTNEELEEYDKHWDSVRIEATIKADALRQGLAMGIEEGIAKGRQEGKQEGMNLTIQILGLYNSGKSIADISEQTAMSAHQIEDLLRSAGLLK